MVVVVEDPCGCAACDLICCEVPMKKVNAEPKKAPEKGPEKKK